MVECLIESFFLHKTVFKKIQLNYLLKSMYGGSVIKTFESFIHNDVHVVNAIYKLHLPSGFKH